MGGQRFKILYIIKQACNFSRLMVMAGKLLLRLKGGYHAEPKYLEWLKDNSLDLNLFLEEIDGPLWNESKKTQEKIEVAAAELLPTIGCDLGGGGCYPLLYFVVRKMFPSVIVETGVGAGFSTYAILLAIEQNNKGNLYSSDFPYFRLKNPEQYIGYIVPDRLKENWKLYVEGDKNNLPLIISEIGGIDLLHYDSDKSYDGREWAMNILNEKLSKSSIVIMDDIQDNNFFYDYITCHDISDWKIFFFEGKYIGLINADCLYGCNSNGV